MLFRTDISPPVVQFHVDRLTALKLDFAAVSQRLDGLDNWSNIT